MLFMLPRHWNDVQEMISTGQQMTQVPRMGMPSKLQTFISLPLFKLLVFDNCMCLDEVLCLVVILILMSSIKIGIRIRMRDAVLELVFTEDLALYAERVSMRHSHDP